MSLLCQRLLNFPSNEIVVTFIHCARVVPTIAKFVFITFYEQLLHHIKGDHLYTFWVFRKGSGRVRGVKISLEDNDPSKSYARKTSTHKL